MKRVDKTYVLIIISQVMTAVAGSVILPFYILFIQQSSKNYSIFIYLYAFFSFASAATFIIGSKFVTSNKLNNILLLSNITAGISLLLVPFARNLYQVILIQASLGISLAFLKIIEKVLVGRIKDKTSKSEVAFIGSYHSWVSLIGAVMMVLTGVFLNIFSLIFLFYVCGAIFIIAGIIGKIIEI